MVSFVRSSRSSPAKCERVRTGVPDFISPRSDRRLRRSASKNKLRWPDHDVALLSRRLVQHTMRKYRCRISHIDGYPWEYSFARVGSSLNNARYKTSLRPLAGVVAPISSSMHLRLHFYTSISRCPRGTCSGECRFIRRQVPYRKKRRRADWYRLHQPIQPRNWEGRISPSAGPA